MGRTSTKVPAEFRRDRFGNKKVFRTGSVFPLTAPGGQAGSSPAVPLEARTRQVRPPLTASTRQARPALSARRGREKQPLRVQRANLLGNPLTHSLADALVGCADVRSTSMPSLVEIGRAGSELRPRDRPWGLKTAWGRTGGALPLRPIAPCADPATLGRDFSRQKGGPNLHEGSCGVSSRSVRK